jgi:ABC-type phosphate transport system substrate-binding protein
VATLAAFASLAIPASAGATTPTLVVGSGSDVAYHVMGALDLLYNQSPGCTIIAPSGTQPLDQSCIPQTGDITTEDTNHDVITENAPIGGSAGVSQLCSQGLTGVANINFARQTSAPSSSVCTGLKYVAYARDGVTWEHFPGVTGSKSANVTNLTQAQLQGIFVTCTITNWSQVGGTSGAIKVYTILPQFGTRKAWDTFLGGSSSSCPGVKQIDQTNNSQIAAADLPNAIVPVSVGSWNERYKAKPGGSAIGSVDGVAPTSANIQSGTFPFSRFLYNVYCAGDPTKSNKCGTASPANAATTRYVGENGWICTAGHHTNNPITGLGYRTMISKTITTFGFAALPKGATGGGTTLVDYCRLFTT